MRHAGGAVAPMIRLFMLVGSVTLLNCQGTNGQPRQDADTIQFGAKGEPDVPSLDGEATFRTIFAEVAEAITPTVVSVIPTIIDTVRYQQNPFYRFFGPPGGGQQPQQQQEEFYRRREGLGSGVIVSQEGYVLTNYHVVAGAQQIEVMLSDDRAFEAEIVGSDSLSDVAVIKIQDPPDNLPLAHLGNSDELRVGDWTIAIGNPFSLSSTVTAGIISALERRVSDNEMYQDFIQTDAAINPGNSGGALVNLDGELIGINTMIYSQTGGFMGIGFAIPINMAQRVMRDLITEGRVIRGWIGVSIQDIDAATSQALGLAGNTDGVLVADVFENQPADQAGIQRGDVIVSINNTDIGNVNQLRNIVAQIPPGTEVPVTVVRDGKERKVRMTPVERTDEQLSQSQQQQAPQRRRKQGEADPENKTGVEVVDISTQHRSRFNIPSGVQGAMVEGVRPNVTDARRALQPGDVITQVKVQGEQARDIKSAKDYHQAVEKIEKGDSVVLLINRGGRTNFISFKYRGD